MTKALVYLGLLLLSTACTKKEPKTAEELQAERLTQQAAKLEKELTEIDDKMKGSNTDFGLQSQLRNERELTRSRLLRIKAALGQTETRAPAGQH
jgi:hypothetical protein